MKKVFTLTTMLMLIAFGVLFPVTVSADSMEVENSAICESVVDREAVNEGYSFPTSVNKLYCLSKIANIQSHTEVVHTWYFGDTQRARVTLNVNPPAWRTYSSKIIQVHETGKWHVKILDAANNLLEDVEFEITP